MRENERQYTLACARRNSPWQSSAGRRTADVSDPDATPTIPAGPPSMPPSSVPVPAPPPSPRIAVTGSAEASSTDAEVDTPSPPSFSAVSAVTARAPFKVAPYLSRALLEIERSEYIKAERTLAKVIHLAPDLPQARYRMGQLLARRGSLSAARRSFLNALQAAAASCGQSGEDEALRWESLVGAELSRLDRR